MSRHSLTLGELEDLRDHAPLPQLRKVAALAIEQRERRHPRLLRSCHGCGQIGDDTDLIVVAAETWHPGCLGMDAPEPDPAA